MLNPAFTAKANRQFGESYCLPSETIDTFAEANEALEAGPETRTEPVHTWDIWSRITSVAGSHIPWQELDVADVCSGAGFLAHHISQRVAPKSMTLIEIAPDELERSKRLLAGSPSQTHFECSSIDAAADQGARFDVVIGNSFVHHFPDVPRALSGLYRMLRPGGLLIGLHEPAPQAITLESGNAALIAGQALLGGRLIDRLRFQGPGLCRPGTVDIWVFTRAGIVSLLENAGFRDARIRSRYLIRPLVNAYLGHRTENSGLSATQQRVVRAAERADRRLAAIPIFPKGFFGSTMFAARKP